MPVNRSWQGQDIEDTPRAAAWLNELEGSVYGVTGAGVRGDGVTDDTIALQAALDTGLPVYIPAGTYKISSALTLKTIGQKIFGQGYASQLLFTGGVGGFAMADTTQRTNITLSDLRLSSQSGGGIGIDGNYFAICAFSRLSIDGGWNKGVRFSNVFSDYNHVSDCRISVSGGGAGNIGVECASTGNENTLTRLRIITDSNSTGVFIDSNACGLYDVDVETGAAIGIRVGANARDTTIYSPYLEANVVNLQIDSGAVATTVVGGTIESGSSSDISDAGTATVLINPRVNFQPTPVSLNQGTTSTDALKLDMAVPSVASTLRDSHIILLRGAYADSGGTGHTVDYRIVNNVTSNTGGSKLRIMSRSDANSYVEKFSIDGSGVGVFGGRIQAGGPVQVPYANKTTTYTVSATTDSVITADATSAAFAVTLPTAVNIQGRSFTVKRTNSGANAVTINTNSSQTIDGASGASGITVKTLGAQWSWITVTSDGANWIITAQGGTVT